MQGFIISYKIGGIFERFGLGLPQPDVGEVEASALHEIDRCRAFTPGGRVLVDGAVLGPERSSQRPHVRPAAVRRSTGHRLLQQHQDNGRVR